MTKPNKFTRSMLSQYLKLLTSLPFRNVHNIHLSIYWNHWPFLCSATCGVFTRGKRECLVLEGRISCLLLLVCTTCLQKDTISKNVFISKGLLNDITKSLKNRQKIIKQRMFPCAGMEMQVWSECTRKMISAEFDRREEKNQNCLLTWSLNIIGWINHVNMNNIAKGTTDPRVEFCLPK